MLNMVLLIAQHGSKQQKAQIHVDTTRLVSIFSWNIYYNIIENTCGTCRQNWIIDTFIDFCYERISKDIFEWKLYFLSLVPAGQKKL